MGTRPNNWRDKREEKFTSAHNRKPGAARFWRVRRNRRQRRRWRREAKGTNVG